MLGFLYLAAVGCSLPVMESDILNGAQSNRFGYLNGYVKTIARFQEALLAMPDDKQSDLQLLLRPVNVAFKPKWLRETARDLDKSLNLAHLTSQGFQTPTLALARIYL
jgi:hypothetical protein